MNIFKRRTPLRQCFQQFLAAKERSPAMVKGYRVTIQQFAAFIGPRARICDLNHDNVIAFLRHLHNQGLAESSIRTKRTNLQSLWTWAALEGLIDRWPSVPQAASLVDQWRNGGEA